MEQALGHEEERSRVLYERERRDAAQYHRRDRLCICGEHREPELLHRLRHKLPCGTAFAPVGALYRERVWPLHHYEHGAHHLLGGAWVLLRSCVLRKAGARGGPRQGKKAPPCSPPPSFHRRFAYRTLQGDDDAFGTPVVHCSPQLLRYRSESAGDDAGKPPHRRRTSWLYRTAFGRQSDSGSCSPLCVRRICTPHLPLPPQTRSEAIRIQAAAGSICHAYGGIGYTAPCDTTPLYRRDCPAPPSTCARGVRIGAKSQ